ncbi:V-type ATP synthase subunit F [Solibaculum mannosilyticum]|mgnify:CR=1 FL=1|uniref:V-type ATP synthase subunit F n=1 Tax=Solibaculum mannosilyticum TaxID=2780922 RepID=A0A7I8D3Y7_9FIRM|nr:V-type ATP synthase subunit F [Solibaculum mannosilyticum]MCO7137847.1 V-type ATP synthase subunit F [[Clostridium] leptum]BCI60472.1 V-type ATP synthase subunit F [Solibaculum mannosilyticum]CZT57017.1 V-type ATP synthase subunit F [Eubacteriaceae bacterium CHKCI005]
MKFQVISDNIDTLVGMRLAGIEGVIAHEPEEVQKALTEAVDDPTIGVVLVTQRLVSLCPDLVYDIKLNQHRLLIVEIPDRHGSGREEDSITRYVREAIGVKL